MDDPKAMCFWYDIIVKLNYQDCVTLFEYCVALQLFGWMVSYRVDLLMVL
ncbi:MAG: hypothetical protein GY880_05450 [Planctomycetaceae bacterium]|nr:hypothetical protein [Planctomycetaceae bacterium]